MTKPVPALHARWPAGQAAKCTEGLGTGPTWHKRWAGRYDHLGFRVTRRRDEKKPSRHADCAH